MTRYAFKAIDLGASFVFAAYCVKAFCTHFYKDIQRRLEMRRLPLVEHSPSLVPVETVPPSRPPAVPTRSTWAHPRRPSSY
jgi:hypothetical protein